MAGPSGSWSGVITQGDSDIKYTAIADGFGRFWTSYVLPLGERSEGSDGTTFWSRDINGNVSIEPAMRRRSFGSRLLGYNAPLYDDALVWTLDGTTLLDGRQTYKLRTSIAKRDAVFYLDVKTALVDGVDIAGRTIRYPVYGRFGSLFVPTRILESEDGVSVMTTVDSVSFEAPPLSSFSAPAPRRPEFPPGRSDVSLDFESPRSLIVVNVQINGSNAKFLIDSGSSSSLIDRDEATSLGLPTAGSVRVAAAKLLVGTVARADTLDVGGVRFHPFVFQAVPLGLPSSIRGYGIKGILGFDVLAQVVARIDYGRARLRLIAPTSFTYAGTGSVIALDSTSRVPRVPATIGEKDPVTFTVDTGSDAGLILYQDFAQSHQRDFLRPGDLASEACGPLGCSGDVSSFFGDLTQANGAGGSIHVKTGYVSRVSLGGFAVAHVFTEIVLQPTGAFVPTQSDGLLGAGVLSRFAAVFLDYPSGRFILER